MQYLKCFKHPLHLSCFNLVQKSISESMVRKNMKDHASASFFNFSFYTVLNIFLLFLFQYFINVPYTKIAFIRAEEYYLPKRRPISK